MNYTLCDALKEGRSRIPISHDRTAAAVLALPECPGEFVLPRRFADPNRHPPELEKSELDIEGPRGGHSLWRRDMSESRRFRARVAALVWARDEFIRPVKFLLPSGKRP